MDEISFFTYDWFLFNSDEKGEKTLNWSNGELFFLRIKAEKF